MMQTYWSVVLNVILLAGVIVAITRLMKANRDDARAVQPLTSPSTPSLGHPNTSTDDIIAVRKVDSAAPHPMQSSAHQTTQTTHTPPKASPSVHAISPNSLVVFLLAKRNAPLNGYTLLENVLAAGLRFGEGHLFHRHQHPNGQGPILCSLAAATVTGMFDLQNIGALKVQGLCLFMHASGNATIDKERLTILLETARKLSTNLDTHLLDDRRQPLSDTSIARYHAMLSKPIAPDNSPKYENRML